MASNGSDYALPQVWQPPHHAKVPALLYGKRGIQEDMGRDGAITRDKPLLNIWIKPN